MKKLFPLLIVVLGFGILLLALNLRESDHYEFGTLTPPPRANNVEGDDRAFSRVFPEPRFIHACSGCGECVHPFEIVENRRVLSIHDHDGWYKVFWSGDEDYYYADPIHMLADWGQNRTAATPAGSWKIRVRAGPATHRSALPHECGQIPSDIVLEYALVVSEDPLEPTFHSGDGPLKVPQTFSWLITNPGKMVSVGWRLVGTPGVEAGPCPCAKP